MVLRTDLRTEKLQKKIAFIRKNTDRKRFFLMNTAPMEMPEENRNTGKTAAGISFSKHQ